MIYDTIGFENLPFVRPHVHVSEKLVFLIISTLGNHHFYKKNFFSCRITTVLDCQMDFRHFPMDQQICHFQVGSCK